MTEFVDVYGKLSILDEMKKKIETVLWKEFNANVFNRFRIRFYEDENDDEHVIRSLGITIFINDSDIVTSLNVLEEIKKVTGADEIYFSVNEGQYIESIELIFEEKREKEVRGDAKD